MDSQVVGIALTAVVGIAGILSTHLLARSQRKGEAARQRSERLDRYTFAEFEARSTLYADFIAELRSLATAVRLRVKVAGAFRRNWGDGLAEKARRDSAKPENALIAEKLTQFADALDLDPTLATRMARERDGGMPPAVDTMPIVRRLTELAARIGILGGEDAAKSARSAEAAAIAAMLRLEALEAADFDKDLPLDELERAITAMEEAAIYELRLLPFGERTSLDDLRRDAHEGKPPTFSRQGKKLKSDGM